MNQEKHSREVSIALERVLDLQAVEKFFVRSFGRIGLKSVSENSISKLSPAGTAELSPGR
jgi:hypothetical protein